MGVCPQGGRQDPREQVTEMMDRLMCAHDTRASSTKERNGTSC